MEENLVEKISETSEKKYIFGNYHQINYTKPIIVLKNPKTDLYNQTKEYIFSESMIWHHWEKATPDKVDYLHDLETKENYSNTPLFSNCVIERSTDKFPCSRITNYDAENFVECVKEILIYNDIRYHNIYRMNVNMTYYVKNSLYTMPHVDHDFPHNNLLIYFNKVSGGEVKVYNNGQWHIHNPEEDDVILFSGLHCHRTPQESNQFRRVLVTTFI